MQSERDRLNLLLSEYVGDNFLSHTDRNMKSRKEALWKLVKSLGEAFGSLNPAQHELFSNTTQNTDSGFNNLFSCYEIGRERIFTIYKQDVKQSEERSTVGRRASNVVMERATNLTSGPPTKRRKCMKVNTATATQPYEEQCYLQ